MQALAYWKTVTADRAGFLDQIVALLATSGIPYCVIGGQAVNAYVEPVVSLDLDIAVVTEGIPRIEALLRDRFKVASFAHSLNASMEGSDLRVQVRTDPRYAELVHRATPREILGLVLPVAAVEDVLRGKAWAALDPGRRPSKRQKDLADIARLIESYPNLRTQVPAEVLSRLV